VGHRITKQPHPAWFDGARSATANQAEQGRCAPLFHNRADRCYAVTTPRLPWALTPSRPRASAPQGSLDGHQGSRLGHAVQDDTAACTACEARFGFCVWGCFPLRSNGTLGSPLGADGRQAVSTERRPHRGRSPRAADCRVGGAHLHWLAATRPLMFACA